MLDQAAEGLSEKLELETHHLAALSTTQTPPHSLLRAKHMDVRLGGFVQILKNWIVIVSTEQTLAD